MCYLICVCVVRCELTVFILQAAAHSSICLSAGTTPLRALVRTTLRHTLMSCILCLTRWGQQEGNSSASPFSWPSPVSADCRSTWLVAVICRNASFLTINLLNLLPHKSDTHTHNHTYIRTQTYTYSHLYVSALLYLRAQPVVGVFQAQRRDAHQN